MNRFIFYTLITAFYAVWMLLVLVVSIHRENNMDDADLNSDLVPTLPTTRASRTMLLIWAAYIIQIVIILGYDFASRG